MPGYGVIAFIGVLATGAGLVATAHAAGQAESSSQGVKAEILAGIGDAESKLNQLAEAMPEDKYAWRPGEGVRSVGEVFVHVMGANYAIPRYLGVQPPEGLDVRALSKSLTTKADIRKALADSFVYLKSKLAAMSDADLDKPAELFGMKTTVRGGYLVVLGHVHEHLGQSIAYARMNGVVPPWSAKQASGKPAGGGM